MDTRDPNLLRVHPLNRTMPRIKPGMPEWTELVRDILQRGVQDCVSITHDGQVVDGWTRTKAAIAAGQVLIPVQVIDDNEVVTKLAEKLVLQKHLTKGQRAFLVYPLLKGVLAEAKTRSLANLQKGHSPISDSIGNRGTTAPEIAAQYGFSEDTLAQARELHAIFDGDAKTLAARNLQDLDGSDLRKEWEEKILDLDHPVGLGAALAGMAGARATRDTEKRPNSQTQMELFSEGVGTLSAVAKNWAKLRTEARPQIVRVWRAAASAWPPEFRRELADALISDIGA